MKNKKSGKVKIKSAPPRKFNVGQIVWAHLTGFPHWPARILSPEQGEGLPGFRKKHGVFVYFFQSGDMAWVTGYDISPWKEKYAEMKEKAYAARVASTHKNLATAMTLAERELVQDAEDGLFDDISLEVNEDDELLMPTVQPEKEKTLKRPKQPKDEKLVKKAKPSPAPKLVPKPSTSKTHMANNRIPLSFAADSFSVNNARPKIKKKEKLPVPSVEQSAVGKFKTVDPAATMAFFTTNKFLKDVAMKIDSAIIINMGDLNLPLGPKVKLPKDGFNCEVLLFDVNSQEVLDYINNKDGRSAVGELDMHVQSGAHDKKSIIVYGLGEKYIIDTMAMFCLENKFSLFNLIPVDILFSQTYSGKIRFVGSGNEATRPFIGDMLNLCAEDMVYLGNMAYGASKMVSAIVLQQAKSHYATFEYSLNVKKMGFKTETFAKLVGAKSHISKTRQNLFTEEQVGIIRMAKQIMETFCPTMESLFGFLGSTQIHALDDDSETKINGPVEEERKSIERLVIADEGSKRVVGNDDEEDSFTDCTMSNSEDEEILDLKNVKNNGVSVSQTHVNASA